MNKAQYDWLMVGATPIEIAILNLLISVEARITKIEEAVREADL